MAMTVVGAQTALIEEDPEVVSYEVLDESEIKS